MFILVIAVLCMMPMLSQDCSCLDLIDLPDFSKLKFNKGRESPHSAEDKEAPDTNEPTRRVGSDEQAEHEPKVERRYWLINSDVSKTSSRKQSRYEDETDDNIKTKIATLVAQTLHDSERKLDSVKEIKEKHRDHAPYKVGFILNMVKKSRDVLNELYNVAMRHRNDWKALEQLKIFELLVHTNVDTSNLVRQLVEVHIQHLNATNTEKKRVILI